ncbi:MAG: hypothetical protein ACK567_13805 [Chitinophagales bacterium]
MKKLFLFTFLIISSYVQSQKVTTKEEDSLMRVNRNGKGVKKFSLKINFLEQILEKGFTLNQLEKTFDEWSSKGESLKISYSWDDKTQDHTILNLEPQYITKINKSEVFVSPLVYNSIEDKIKSIEIGIDLSVYEYNDFYQSLIKKGYFLNPQLTSIFKDKTYSRKDKKHSVKIQNRGNSIRYWIKIF